MNEPRQGVGFFLDGPFSPEGVHNPSKELRHIAYVGIPWIVPSYGMTVRVLLYRSKRIGGPLSAKEGTGNI